MAGAGRTPPPDEAALDYGADGPAMRARPSAICETIRAGVTYRHYADAHLVDRMAARDQLSEVQHKAALRVLELHEAAGFEPGVCSGYSPPGWNRGHDDDEPERAAITRFRKLLGGCSRGAADLLHGMCLEIHPGVSRLGTLQATLDDLARAWGYAR